RRLTLGPVGAFRIAMFFGNSWNNPWMTTRATVSFSAEKARQGEIIVPARTPRITTRRDVHRDVVS
ncbi:hypothetical protein, partial [Mesorhizobium sp.]|uniref:hypothetical protein n=1 Tax=Mesorhizobium sp. TaxID=1871066 RepID=UPI0025D544C2